MSYFVYILMQQDDFTDLECPLWPRFIFSFMAFLLSFQDSPPLSQTKGINEGHDAAICGRSAKNGKSTDRMARPVFSAWFQQVLENTVCLDAFSRENT